MTELRPLNPEDYERLYEIIVADEPFAGNLTFEQVSEELSKREGWSIWSDEKLIGAITLSGFTPLLNVMLHAVVDKDFHGRWAARSILKQVFSYCFDDLKVRRISSYSIFGVTYQGARMLTMMGFKVEGITEKGFRSPDGEFYDVVNYGMLQERCPWLWKKEALRNWVRWRRSTMP